MRFAPKCSAALVLATTAPMPKLARRPLVETVAYLVSGGSQLRPEGTTVTLRRVLLSSDDGGGWEIAQVSVYGRHARIVRLGRIREVVLEKVLKQRRA